VISINRYYSIYYNAMHYIDMPLSAIRKRVIAIWFLC